MDRRRAARVAQGSRNPRRDVGRDAKSDASREKVEGHVGRWFSCCVDNSQGEGILGKYFGSQGSRRCPVGDCWWRVTVTRKLSHHGISGGVHVRR